MADGFSNLSLDEKQWTMLDKVRESRIISTHQRGHFKTIAKKRRDGCFPSQLILLKSEINTQLFFFSNTYVTYNHIH
jgi:hypothetical protein